MVVHNTKFHFLIVVYNLKELSDGTLAVYTILRRNENCESKSDEEEEKDQESVSKSNVKDDDNSCEKTNQKYQAENSKKR